MSGTPCGCSPATLGHDAGQGVAGRWRCADRSQARAQTTTTTTTAAAPRPSYGKSGAGQKKKEEVRQRCMPEQGGAVLMLLEELGNAEGGKRTRTDPSVGAGRPYLHGAPRPTCGLLCPP